MGKNLRIRLRDEDTSPLLQLRAERGVILDDSVVDKGQITAVGHMRMSVDLSRKPVRGPTRVGDSEAVVSAFGFRQTFGKQPVEG